MLKYNSSDRDSGKVLKNIVFHVSSSPLGNFCADKAGCRDIFPEAATRLGHCGLTF